MLWVSRCLRGIDALVSIFLTFEHFSLGCKATQKLIIGKRMNISNVNHEGVWERQRWAH